MSFKAFLSLLLFFCGPAVLGQDLDAEDLFYEKFQAQRIMRRIYSQDSLKTVATRLTERGERRGEGVDIVKGKILTAVALIQEQNVDSASVVLDLAEKWYLTHRDQYFSRENGSIHLYRSVIYVTTAKLNLAFLHAQKAREIFSKTGDRLNQSLALAAMGNAEFLRLNYGAALQHYLNSHKIKLTLSDPKERYDPALQLNLANVYTWMGQLTKALQTSLEATRILEKEQLERPFPNAYLIVGTVYNKLGVQDSAIFYFQKAISVAKANNMTDQTAMAIYTLANLYRQQGDFAKSSQLAEQALALNPHSDSQLTLTVLLARNEMSQGNYSRAAERIRALQKVFPKETYPLELLELDEVMADLFRYENNKDSLIRYLDRVIALKNNIHSVENQQKLTSFYAELETLSSQQEIKLLEQQKKIDQADKRTLITTMVGGGLTALLAIAIIFLQYQAKRKQQLLRMYQLEDELKHQKADLHAQTLKMIYLNNSVGEIEERLKKLKNGSTANSNEIQQLLNSIQINRGVEKEWEKFEHYFSSVHGEFYKNFIAAYPNLSVIEKRLASLIVMDLTNSEIASLMNIGVGSVKTAKHRLKKKLDLREEQDLHEFLAAFARLDARQLSPSD